MKFLTYRGTIFSFSLLPRIAKFLRYRESVYIVQCRPLWRCSGLRQGESLQRDTRIHLPASTLLQPLLHLYIGITRAWSLTILVLSALRKITLFVWSWYFVITKWKNRCLCLLVLHLSYSLKFRWIDRIISTVLIDQLNLVKSIVLYNN